MNMKKILLMGIIVVASGCTDELVKDPIYNKNGTAYMVTTNKPVNGIVENQKYRDKEYLIYKKGKVLNLKKIDSKGNLIEEINYDTMGLFHGIVLKRKNKVEYNHGVRIGEVKTGKVVEYLKDGVVHGQVRKNEKIRYYDNGLEVAVAPKNEKIAKLKRIWGEVPPENYTGELYSKPFSKQLMPVYNVVLEIRGYKKGVLKYVKYYNRDGMKQAQYYLMNDDSEKMSESLKYYNGYLNEQLYYNENGNIDGVSTWSGFSELKTETYIDGIPHGPVKIIDSATNKNTRSGVYKLGIFTGESYGINYIDGLQNEKTIVESSLPLDIKEKVEGKNFTGLIKRKSEKTDNKNLLGLRNKKAKKDILIDEYLDGRIVKSYTYRNETLQKIKTFLEESPNNYSPDTEIIYPKGSYIEETYCNGLLKSRIYYDSNGVGNGKILSVEHTGSITTANLLDGKMNGISTHYHGDKIISIDKYDLGKTYSRTIYYDYENKKISGESQGKYIEKYNRWINVGTHYKYSKEGYLETKIEYGNDLSLENENIVQYIEYYDGKKVKMRYSKDYNGDIYKGEKKEYDINGKLLKVEYYDIYGRKKREAKI